jgi:hypothetical protein
MTNGSRPVRRIFRLAAISGFVWVGFQTMMMLYSRNLTPGGAALNIVPVLLLSLGALRANAVATLVLAAYGALRLWMAFPIVVQLLGDSSTMPKHWWIALVAIPFACLWLSAGYRARSLVRR